MSSVEVRQGLAALQLTQREAATLLGVSPRSVRRWLEGEAIPGPAEAALRAWGKLEARGLAWRPDSVTLFEDDQERIAVYRQEAMNLDALLERVSARGGPRLPWKVDTVQGLATMEWATLSFYKLQNGGFSPATYRRGDQNAAPDLERDRELIEDGLFCIAAAFETIERRVRALRAVAENIRANISFAVTAGPRMLEPAEKELRNQSMHLLAERLDLLVDRTEAGEKTTYTMFEKIRVSLTEQGVWAERQLISDVARSFFEGAPKARLIFMRRGRLDSAITGSQEYPVAVLAEKIAGHRLLPMGEKLRPINGTSSEYSGPEHVVVHVPVGVDLPGAQEPGYYVVADLHPRQLQAQ